MAEGDMVSGRYRMAELIGRGGMGEVWRAQDELLERPVAVKFARLQDKRTTERLKSEARNAGRLHHPNIVAVFDFLEDGTTCWIVMEYVPSRSLAQIMAERGPLTPEETGSIGCQIADALAASHAEGVVHGDVTPENVLVKDDGVAKLTDFGISRALWTDPTFDGNTTGGVRGKPRYLPPEVASGGRADRMSDVFSLGATLYSVVEGRSPYGEAEYPMAYIGRALKGAVEEPRRAGPLTEPLAALLEIEPKRRPGAAMARKLLSGAAPPPPHIQEQLHDAPELGGFALRLLPRSRRSWRAVGAVAVTVVAVVLATGVLLWEPWAGDGGTRAPVSAQGKTSADGKASADGSVAVLGDVRTADPCALLDTHSFTRFGDAEMAMDYGEFDRCDVLLVKGDDGEAVADIKLDFASDPSETDSQARIHKAGKVGVVEMPEADGECDRNLRLPDGNQVWISAVAEDSSAPDLCTLAKVATDHAVTVLNRGPVPRRPSPFPPNSLARLDACDLLDAPTLAVLPDVAADEPAPDFADWGCKWSSKSSSTGVNLSFSRDNDLKDDGKPRRLGGRESYVAPEYEGDHTCTVMTVNRTYTDTAGEHTIEYVGLETYGPQPATQLCDTAETLATAVAKKLPVS